jgi:hypothetical protein
MSETQQFYATLARYQRVTIKTMSETTREMSFFASLILSLSVVFARRKTTVSAEQQRLSRILKIA